MTEQIVNKYYPKVMYGSNCSARTGEYKKKCYVVQKWANLAKNQRNLSQNFAAPSPCITSDFVARPFYRIIALTPGQPGGWRQSNFTDALDTYWLWELFQKFVVAWNRFYKWKKLPESLIYQITWYILSSYSYGPNNKGTFIVFGIFRKCPIFRYKTIV